MILVTGGCGFIGSNFIHYWLTHENQPLVNIDKLTYAGNPLNLQKFNSDPRYHFIRGDICDRSLLLEIFHTYKPNAIIHFAAESHVDRSIYGPQDFIQTNILGTFQLLESFREYLNTVPRSNWSQYRMIHISTDEVFGSLTPEEPPFTEINRYAPNSPYAASKASSDHLVRAYHHTYQLPLITTNCSNNYGPYQFPEKFIPLVICNALEGQPIPIYGDGLQIRDWLYVEDHVRGLIAVLKGGTIGETYNIGGRSEKTNRSVAELICERLDHKCPLPNGQSYKSLITFVADRPGHDRRYAIDCQKIEKELGWKPRENFLSGIEKTIDWYLNHKVWIEQVKNQSYRNWIKQNYEKRLASRPE
ncbi:MAG: dTDP-glucose 4,6-dehydratase [Pseudobdellovibrionaceae bacterium]|nr:dTDP-glucose 4,6-dehydratase [Pseudobdellovibrionaceae bacterium]